MMAAASDEMAQEIDAGRWFFFLSNPQSARGRSRKSADEMRDVITDNGASAPTLFAVAVHNKTKKGNPGATASLWNRRGNKNTPSPPKKNAK